MRSFLMNKRLGVVLVCGLGVGSAGCGSDTGGSPGTKPDGAADAGADVPVDSGAGVAVDVAIMPPPVLDPNGTYGGKTVAEWGAEWLKWIYERPGPESLAFNTPGATCEMGQSTAMGDGGTDAPPFFLGIWDMNNDVGGTFAQACGVPIGRTILFDASAIWADSIPGCTQGSEQDCRNVGLSWLRSVTGLELEIDGKSYGSQVADFAPYLTGCTHASAAIPNTPDNPMVAFYGCTSTQSVLQYDAWVAGYWIMLAPLAPGPHTIHTRVQGLADDPWPAYLYDVTYNLTVADTSLLGTTDGGVPVDANHAASFCTGPASGALIDDMSGSNISLAPPSCGSPGGWTASAAAPGVTFSGAPGVLATPAGDTSIVSNCGSLCQSLYSPLPAGLPSTMASSDAGPVDSGTADGGESSPQAMCVAGQTGPEQYYWSGMTLTFAYSGTPPSRTGPTKVPSPSLGFTTDPPPALIDASQYAGIELWLWASPDTATAMSAAFVVQLVDKNQLPGGGVCNPNAISGTKPCSRASAAIASSTAAKSQSTGALFAADGSKLTSLAPGWQLVRAPWSSFVSNPSYGGGNEQSVDPRTLAFAGFVVEQDNASGSAIPFDFCVYGLRFYK
jgi:hypothetical protein